MSTKSVLGVLAAGAVLFGVAATVTAHPGHNTHGFAAGVTHPVSGLDHLLAMFAVGLWASRIAGTRKWLLPLMFVSGMILGMVLGVLTVPVPSVELGIAGSVIAFGLLIAVGRDVPFGVAMGLTVLFALFHGHAHGAEMPENSSALSYGLGMILVTTLLHVSGIAVGTSMRGARGITLLRLGGTAVTCSGLLLLAGAL